MSSYSICIATYKRPLGLRSLLDSLEVQELDPGDSVEILVVDNDPRSSESVVEHFAASSRFDVRYLTQPEQNISVTRNVAVEAAQGDFVWFIDDDEVAISNCLALLASAQREFDADGVFGPVIPEFESPQPRWIADSSVFNRPIHATGNTSTSYRTSNTLVRTSLLKGADGPFDPDFGITGGSDSMLFRQLAREGAYFIDSADAVVYETVTASRSTWEWMTARRRRQGQNFARQTVILNDGALNAEVASMLAKAAVLLVTHGAAALWKFRSEERSSEHRLRLHANIGKFEGVRGVLTERML